MVKHQASLRVLLLSNYINVFAYSLFAPLYTIFVLRLGANALLVSQLLGVYSLVYGLGLLVFGKLQNRMKRKDKIVVSGFFFLSLGAFAYLAIHSLSTAFLVQIWNALAAAWIMPAYKALYGRSEDPGRETEEWSWVDGGDQLLVAAATFLGGVIMAVAGFPVLITVVGFLQLAGALFSMTLLPKRTWT